MQPALGAWFRRHPKLHQRAAIGAIAGGVAVFTASGVLAPTGAADLAARPPAAAAPSDATDGWVPALGALPPSPSVAEGLTGKPARSARLAPATHGVISGLAANGIPSVALNAYRVAATRMKHADAGCGINWSLLAGIGREESDHGRFGGAVLHADGVSTPPIVGPALDGVHWDYVPAPANGLALDGDATYAHALGPMQFIPSTWAIYGTDATGDGRADIFNINDAALSAARYLCTAGGDLRTQAGQVRAVLAYNHSDQYLAQVLALADAYRRGIPIRGIPVGILSGPLPAVDHTGSIPPANPGAPTAVQHPNSHEKQSGTKPRSSPRTSPTPASRSRASAAAPSTRASTAKPKPVPSATPTTSQPTAPLPTAAPTPTPSPSPTKSCTLLEKLLHKC
jgi:membrane-bound lytic murein transglycosylase B